MFYVINGLALGDGGAIEVQNFKFAQKLNQRTTVELYKFARLTQTVLCAIFLSVHLS